MRFGRLCRRCLRDAGIGRESALRISARPCGLLLRGEFRSFALRAEAGGVLSRTVLRAHGGGARFFFGGMACGAFCLYRRLPLRRLVGKRALRAGFRRRRFFRGLPQSLFARFGREHARFRVRVLLAECGVQLLVVLAGTVLALEIGAQRVVVKRGEYARIALAVEVTEYVLVLAVETQPAALAEEGYPVAFVQVLHGVRDDHYRAPLAGKFLEQIHHLQVEVGGESAGRLVEEDDLRVGEQFHGYGNAFALSAGEGGYLQIFASGQFHVRDRLFHTRPDLFARHFAAHTEHRRVAEGGLDGEIVVHYVLLRNVADDVLVRPDVVVIGVGVVVDTAVGGGAQPVKTVQQSGLARARTAHDRHECARFYAEGHRVHQSDFAVRFAVRHILCDAYGVDLYAGGRRRVEQLALVERVRRRRYGYAVVIA